MDIGEPEKVTTEPKPIRVPKWVPPPPKIPMPVSPERERVPARPLRREVGIAEPMRVWGSSLEDCPYCGRDLIEKDMEIGSFLACPEHGVLEVVR